MMQMTHRQFPNSYIASLCRAQQQWGDMGASPTKGDLHGGFREIPIEQDPPRERDQAEKEICPLSPAQLRDIGAVTAEVVQITPETNYIKILLPDGKTETAFCGYASALSAGDRLYVLIRQRGRQTTTTILGLVPPDRKEGNKCMTIT